MRRVLDFGCALMGIVVLLPVLAVIAIAVKLTSPGPVIFAQTRVGLQKRHFRMYKFRTMSVGSPDLPTHMILRPERYLTPIGGVLRRSSLDELPQLFNVLKGDMGIIGPRPALWNQLDLVEEREKLGANDVRPGLTGWAQINGRDELTIAEKAALDGYYVQNRGVVLDLKCLLGSIVAVVKAEGVAEGRSEDVPGGLPVGIDDSAHGAEPGIADEQTGRNGDEFPLSPKSGIGR